MQELIDQLWRIRLRSKEYGTALENKLNTNNHDARCACFPMIFNKCTMTIELLVFYQRLWGNPYVVNDLIINANAKEAQAIIEQSKQDNWDRCMEQTKMFFVGVISSMEYCAKQSVKLCSSTSIGQSMDKIEHKKRIYLNDIIKESNKLGMISAEEKYKWECLIRLRNSAVHNNCVVEEDDTYTIDSVTVTLKKGEMMQANLDIFTNLTESALGLYNDWINKL
jgi:hypothetical protein